MNVFIIVKLKHCFPNARSSSNEQLKELRSKNIAEDYSSSDAARIVRRIAFACFIRFLTEGFVKNARFFTSFKIPDRSYFFLNRRKARSMGSFSPIRMPTKKSPPSLKIHFFKQPHFQLLLP